MVHFEMPRLKKTKHTTKQGINQREDGVATPSQSSHEMNHRQKRAVCKSDAQ